MGRRSWRSAICRALWRASPPPALRRNPPTRRRRSASPSPWTTRTSRRSRSSSTVTTASSVWLWWVGSRSPWYPGPLWWTLSRQSTPSCSDRKQKSRRGDRPTAVPSPLFAFTRSGAWLAGVEVDGWSAYSAACGIPSTAFWRRAVPAALPETPASGRSSCGIQRNTSHRCFDREAYSDHSNPDAAFVRSWVQYMLLFYAALPCLCKNLVKLLGSGAGDDRNQIEV